MEKRGEWAMGTTGRVGWRGHSPESQTFVLPSPASYPTGFLGVSEISRICTLCQELPGTVQVPHSDHHPWPFCPPLLPSPHTLTAFVPPGLELAQPHPGPPPRTAGRARALASSGGPSPARAGSPGAAPRWFAAAETAAPATRPPLAARRLVQPQSVCSRAATASPAAAAGAPTLSASSAPPRTATASPPSPQDAGHCRLHQDGLCMEQLEKSGYSIYFSSACLRCTGTPGPGLGHCAAFHLWDLCMLHTRELSVGGSKLVMSKINKDGVWILFLFFFLTPHPHPFVFLL